MRGHDLLHAVRLIGGLVAIVVAGLLVVEVVNDAAANATTLGLLVFLIAGLIALLMPERFVEIAQRIKKLGVGGVNVEFERERLKRIAERFPEMGDGVSTPARPRGDRPEEDVEKVAHELRRKLRFIEKAVLGGAQSPREELVIARLEQVALLTPDEADLCNRVLGELSRFVSDLDADDRDDFLDSAWRFAFRLATEVFDRQARQRFNAGGWFVSDFDQPKGRRRDFVVERDGKRLVTAARVASPTTSIDATVKRLARRGGPLPEARRVIVVPDYVDHLPSEMDNAPQLRGPDASVAVVRLHVLLDHPEQLTDQVQ